MRTVHLLYEPPDWQAAVITVLPLTEALDTTEATTAQMLRTVSAMAGPASLHTRV